MEKIIHDKVDLDECRSFRRNLLNEKNIKDEERYSDLLFVYKLMLKDKKPTEIYRKNKKRLHSYESTRRLCERVNKLIDTLPVLVKNKS